MGVDTGYSLVCAVLNITQSWSSSVGLPTDDVGAM